MANKENEVKFDLDKLHADVHQEISVSSTPEERVESADKFNAMLDAYDRYLDEKQKELRQKPVKTKEIVADEDAVAETLKHIMP